MSSSIYDLVKDRRVYSIEADRTVLEGARFMMEHNIGALPVLRNGGLVGIFSERDIMNRVVAVGRMPGTTKISEVMTANPKAVHVEESMENCVYLMREFGFREFRVRHHDNLVRIEIAPAELDQALRREIVDELALRFRALGFKYVTLDLHGYRTGAMNEVLAMGHDQQSPALVSSSFRKSAL